MLALKIVWNPSPIVHVPYEEAYSEGFEDMERRVPDISKIGALVGYRNTHTLEDILARVIAFEKTRCRTT